MNGQYLMNKEISVQYAYKKDGKGERHGDQAERMLAAQARKHNVQPAVPQLQLFPGGAPSIAATMMDTDGGRSGGVGGIMTGRSSLSNGSYPSMPPQQQRPPPPSQPLQAPPSGLPARPPPSQAGYGGPQGFLPPGLTPQHQGYPPPGAPPPSGFTSPSIPPGFQPPAYGRGRGG